MGRKRRRIRNEAGRDLKLERKVEERLGLEDKVCTRCNSRNDKNASKCRNCGHTELRKKAKEYRNS